ncbi:MAG: hypothetical protein IJ746_02420 [Ruminococcus sp.]|nr:hypothetical protein [Ruminococcus sp.]
MKEKQGFSFAVALMPIFAMLVMAMITKGVFGSNVPLLLFVPIPMAAWVAARAYAFFIKLSPGARTASYHIACAAALICYIIFMVLSIDKAEAQKEAEQSGMSSHGIEAMMTAMFYGIPNFILLVIDLIGNYINKEN